MGINMSRVVGPAVAGIAECLWAVECIHRERGFFLGAYSVFWKWPVPTVVEEMNRKTKMPVKKSCKLFFAA